MLIMQSNDVTKAQYSIELAKIMEVSNKAYNYFTISEIECKGKI